MLLIRTKLTLFIFVMLRLFFLVSGCISRWVFICEGVILGCIEYGDSLFFFKLSVMNDYFVYRPSLKDSVDWFILMTNFMFGLVLL